MAEGGSRAGERSRVDADAAYADLAPRFRELQASGMSLQGIIA